MHAIKASGLSKRYELGAAAPDHRFSELLMRAASAPLRLFSRRRAPTEELWALHDVSFEVAPGEVVGVIGRNGAGKSTLLKILSRIVEPTAGEAVLHGRVGSLLEVGTGFHSELTGRENVYLNGAILGMSRGEIDAKFDEIVAFSEVERFLDTPVKRYSSGMRMRLAFAVAAHLEPEILLIDEVLAVGDAPFQKKCLGKMSSVAREGRTILFVSHNMSAVEQLCDWSMVLEGGAIGFVGPTSEAIEFYLRNGDSPRDGPIDLRDHPGRPPDKQTLLTGIELTSTGDSSAIRSGDDLTLRIEYDTRGQLLDYVMAGINTLAGQRVATVGTHMSPGFDEQLEGRGAIECNIPDCRLAPGEYSVMIAMGTATPKHNLDQVDDALRFDVQLGNYYDTGAVLLQGQGLLVQRSTWRRAGTPAPRAHVGEDGRGTDSC